MPYVEKERDMLNLDGKQRALLIIDVFSGQMTKTVIDKIAENYIKLVKVPANFSAIRSYIPFCQGLSRRS